MRAVRRRPLALIAGFAVAALLLVYWWDDGPAGMKRDDAEAVDETGADETDTDKSNRRVASLSEGEERGEEAARSPNSDSQPEFPTVAPGVPPDLQANDDTPADDEIERIYLDPVVADGVQTMSLSGFDPYAPRELVAWRILHDRAVVMSRGSSDSGGVIHFPEIPAPRDGFQVVVSEAGVRLELQGASLRRTLEPRLPTAPHAQISGTAAGEYALHIVPNETTGEVLLADFAGNVFAAYDVPNDPAPANRVIDVSLSLPETDREIWMAHLLEGGRVSEWRVLRFAPPKVEPETGL